MMIASFINQSPTMTSMNLSGGAAWALVSPSSTNKFCQVKKETGCSTIAVFEKIPT
jgi:hypothetical protein